LEAAILRPVLSHRLQFLFQPLYLALNDAAVTFKLGLARASGADAAAEALQVRPSPRQAGQEILLLGELDLKSSFMGLRPLGEDIQNQGRAVYYLYLKQLFQVALLRRGELIIEDDQIISGLLFKRNQLLEFALAYIVSMVRVCQALGK
jgi:hypothetical protein